jgi:5,6-dimethylbenzimidazole synthase
MHRTPPTFSEDFRKTLHALFVWRRDVRHFTPMPIPAKVLDELLATASLAPSVGLSQPWRFVSVDDPARRAAVRASFQASNAAALGAYEGDRARLYASLKLSGMDEAPCHVAVFAEPDATQGAGLGRMTMPETSAYSAVLAIHTLWLAARAAGIGMGWISILEPEKMHGILDVPAHWTFIGYLCLGYPAHDSDTPELEETGWERRASVVRVQR